jgi:hypothetical protein
VVLLLTRPVPAGAGSSQAALAVGAVVPAGCAVRTPSRLGSSQPPGAGAQDAVAMRCTKGTVRPAGAASVVPAGGSASTAPRPVTERSPIAAAAADEPRMTITINF